MEPIRDLSDLGFKFGKDGLNELAAVMFFVASILTVGRIDILKELADFAQTCSEHASSLAQEEEDGPDILDATEIDGRTRIR